MSIIKGQSISYVPSLALSESISPFASIPWPQQINAPFTPADLPGLAFWYDPSDAGTVTLDSSSGQSRVTTLLDKSGNGHTLTQVTDAQRFEYVVDGWRNKNILRSNSVNAGRLGLAAIPFFGDNDYFIAFKGGSAAGFGADGATLAGLNIPLTARIDWNTRGANLISAGATAVYTADTALVVPFDTISPQIMELYAVANNYGVNLNNLGVVVVPGIGGAMNFQGTGPCAYVGMEIYEIIGCSGLLTVEQRQQTYDYLLARWAVI